MNIVVLVKQVPDTETERKLDPADSTVDRAASDGVINELDEYAIEEALRLKEKHGGEVTILTVGPEQATDSIRKALSMGADKAVHVCDDALAGSDALQTAYAIAQTLGTLEYDLVILGSESTDARTGVVGAALAEYLGLPQLTHMRTLEVGDGVAKGERETDEGVFEVEATLPCVVSVGEKINEPRFPSFKGIMAAKKKPVEVLTLSDTNVETGQVGKDNASSTVTSSTPKPARTAGEKVTDEGEGGNDIAKYLVAQKLI